MDNSGKATTIPPTLDLGLSSSHLTASLKTFGRGSEDGELLNVLGVAIRVKISSEESGGAISLFVTSDPPRLGPPMHIHHNEDETFYVLDGEYRVRVEEDEFSLQKGQMAFFPRGVPHCYANEGGTTGQLLVITTPGGFENFFRDVDALCKQGDPAPELLTAVGGKYGLDFVGPPIFA